MGKHSFNVRNTQPQIPKAENHDPAFEGGFVVTDIAISDPPLSVETVGTSFSAEERQQRRAIRKQRRIKKRCSTFLLPVALLYIEWVFQLFVYKQYINADLFLFLPVFSLLFGSLLSGIFCWLSDKANRIATAISLGALATYFSIHLVYQKIFRSIFRWNTLGLAGGAIADFAQNTIGPIIASIVAIILLFAPFILFLIFQKKLYLPACRHTGPQFFAFFLSIVMLLVSVFSINLNGKRRQAFFVLTYSDPDATLRHYGVIAETGLDIWYSAFGAPQESPDVQAETVDDDARVDEQKEIVYYPQILNIDFAALKKNAPNAKIREMHEFFEHEQPTFENEYTGYFRGKNLIFLSLEGFSYKVIDPELTPTLYKMYTQGFCFNNFYDSVWGGSTATGEYSNMTGNFYNSANCLKMSANTLTYSAFGNLFRTAGYNTYAYHNHTYTYYGRDRSHPNFGYRYKAIGKGMKLPKIVWPNSDLEMSQVTADEYIQPYLNSNKQTPFHAYYMTVSGHANYNWGGNSMSSRHREDLPAKYDGYSENVRAYLACQYEVELMLTDLVNRLDQAGILNDTVFAMCCDHYPYALTDSELAEFYGISTHDLRNNFDLYRNAFVLWSASMEKPVEVNVPCSSVDMVPTLCNLFGLKYDSRLIIGKDILSDCEKITILNTESTWWNWITEKGVYSSARKKFTPAAGVTMTADEMDEYVDRISRIVNNRRIISFGILDRDYYKYVFKKDFSLKYQKAPDSQKAKTDSEPVTP